MQFADLGQSTQAAATYERPNIVYVYLHHTRSPSLSGRVSRVQGKNKRAKPKVGIIKLCLQS